MSVIPKLPSYPASSLQTGSYTSGGEYVVYSTGQEYIGNYFVVLGRNIPYTGKFPYDPNNETSSTPKVTSNVPLRSLSSLGITPSGALKIPASFSPVPLLEHYQNTVMPRFFARDLIKKEYREISFDDYEKILKKNPAWDYKNWEVKAVHQGWKLNSLRSECYLENKTKILYMDKGKVFPKSPTSPTIPPLVGISDTDLNDPIPWPGFKEWFTDNTWVEKYFYVGKTLNTASGSAITTENVLNDPKNIYTVYDPKKPIEFTFYSLYISTGGDLNYFTEFFCEVESDVLVAPGGAFLTPTKVPPNTPSIFTGHPDTYFRCNLSEIYLPTPKNPNALLTNPRPELVFKHNGTPYPSGQFCKTQQGQFFAGNLPPATSKYNPAVAYNQSPRELLEVKRSLPVSDSTPSSQIQETWIYLISGGKPKKDFTTLNVNGQVPINTQAFNGTISQPFLFAEEATGGVTKLDKRYFSGIPYNTQTSFQVRKIYYRYVRKEDKWFEKSSLSEINSFANNNQPVPLEYFYEGWINYFDPITNEDNPYFTAPNLNPTNSLISSVTYTPNNSLPISNANYWGVRTGILPSSESKIIFTLYCV